MVERRLAHYVLLEKLGSGAMGEVWAAEDEKLGRRVALKVLGRELAREPERLARFVREVQALAALSHPAITTIYAVEEADGAPFYTMELVEGTTLEELVPPGGLPVERVVAIGLQLADALAAAHGKDIVHRDLKPANVMVTGEGRVKVLDFGLSKLRGGDGTEGRVRTVTQEGALVGTVPYMSPEQVQARDVDPRSDLFSLGGILYEMAAGRRPFPQDNLAELVSAILRDDPAPLAQLRPDLPGDLVRLVQRCLAKDPDERPAAAAEVRRELAALAAGTRPGPLAERSIAVLPFGDLSPERDQDWFCAGLAEELIHALNRVQGLRVAARSSAFLFQGQAVDASEVGRRLNVDTVLEGTVRKDGDRLRITTELVDVDGGYDLWSERYDCRTEEVFAVQERIARSIVDALQVALSPREWRAMRQFGTPVPGAYEYYLKGRRYLNDYSRRGAEFAIELFRRAVEADSGFAPAHAGIAEACSFLFANAAPKREHLDCALDASRTALELAPLLAAPHVARGVALSLDHADREAEAAFGRAVELDPQSFEAHYFWARHLFERGAADEAVRHYRRAAELRPEDYQAPLLVAQILDDLGRPDEAAAARRRGVAVAQERLKLSPDDTRALYMGANGLVALGDVERGLAWARRARELSPEDTMLLYNLACIHALAGEVEPAIDCVEAAVRNGFANRDWLEHDSNLDPLRADARFLAIVSTVP